MQTRRYFVGLLLVGLLVGIAGTAFAEAPPSTSGEGAISRDEVYNNVGLAMAAAFTAAISILGAGIAVGRVGSAALGAAAENPELLTRSLLFVALAEGLAVLGFAVAMLIVMKIS